MNVNSVAYGILTTTHRDCLVVIHREEYISSAYNQLPFDRLLKHIIIVSSLMKTLISVRRLEKRNNRRAIYFISIMIILIDSVEKIFRESFSFVLLSFDPQLHANLQMCRKAARRFFSSSKRRQQKH